MKFFNRKNKVEPEKPLPPSPKFLPIPDLNELIKIPSHGILLTEDGRVLKLQRWEPLAEVGDFTTVKIEAIISKSEEDLNILNKSGGKMRPSGPPPPPPPREGIILLERDLERVIEPKSR